MRSYLVPPSVQPSLDIQNLWTRQAGRPPLHLVISTAYITFINDALVRFALPGGNWFMNCS